MSTFILCFLEPQVPSRESRLCPHRDEGECFARRVLGEAVSPERFPRGGSRSSGGKNWAGGRCSALFETVNTL